MIVRLMTRWRQARAAKAQAKFLQLPPSKRPQKPGQQHPLTLVQTLQDRALERARYSNLRATLSPSPEILLARAVRREIKRRLVELEWSILTGQPVPPVKRAPTPDWPEPLPPRPERLQLIPRP